MGLSFHIPKPEDRLCWVTYAALFLTLISFSSGPISTTGSYEPHVAPFCILVSHVPTGWDGALALKDTLHIVEAGQIPASSTAKPAVTFV